MAHQNRARVAQLSYSDNVRWFYPSFLRNSRFTCFWWSRGLREILRPGSGLGTGQTRQKVDFPALGGRFCRNARRPNFVVWGLVLSVRDPTDKKPFWPQLGATEQFSGLFLAHQNRVRVAQLSSSYNIGWSPEFSEQFAVYWVLKGSGHFFWEIAGPN